MEKGTQIDTAKATAVFLMTARMQNDSDHWRVEDLKAKGQGAEVLLDSML